MYREWKLFMKSQRVSESIGDRTNSQCWWSSTYLTPLGEQKTIRFSPTTYSSGVDYTRSKVTSRGLKILTPKNFTVE